MKVNDVSLNNIVELHVHAGPDVRDRKMHARDLVQKSNEAGMKAIVLKNHNVPTMLEASVLNHEFDPIKIFGGIALNYPVGGLNPSAVETALNLNAKIIWMPTHDSENEQSFYNNPGTGICILDENNKITEKVWYIIEQVKASGCILATGHLSYREIISLLKACREKKVNKLLINHPGIVFQRFNAEQQREMIRLGAYLEHSYCRPPLYAECG